MLAARRRHYVELVLAGTSYAEAAMPQPKPTGPRYLSMDERIFIADGPVCGLSMSAIASRLGRSRSTVCREVARNRDRGTGRYTPYRASEMVAARRRRPKPRKLEDRRLAAAVQAKLDAHWSPEQISHWLAAEYPDNEGMNASTETIYQAIYIRAKGQFKRDISQQLRSGRTARKAEDGPRCAQAALPRADGDDLRAAARGGGPRRAGPLGSRPHNGRREQERHRHAGGEVEPERHPAAPARRPRLRQGAADHRQEDGEASQAYAKLADVGPGLGDDAARQDIGGAGHGRLLLRPALAMAARRQREHERPAAAVLPEGHRPEHLPRGVSGRRRRGAQRQAPQDARVEEAQRGVPGVDKQRFADSLESGTVDRGCCDVP